jgi:hypothetical protein
MEQRSISFFTRYITGSHVQEVKWDPEPILKDLQLENSLQPPGINPQSSSSLSFVSMFTLYVACILLIILYLV